MITVLSWIAAITSHPLFQGVIRPGFENAVKSFLEGAANKLELRSAVASAKAAKTAEDLRAASVRLTDASRR